MARAKRKNVKRRISLFGTEIRNSFQLLRSGVVTLKIPSRSAAPRKGFRGWYAQLLYPSCAYLSPPKLIINNDAFDFFDRCLTAGRSDCKAEQMTLGMFDSFTVLVNWITKPPRLSHVEQYKVRVELVRQQNLASEPITLLSDVVAQEVVDVD